MENPPTRILIIDTAWLGDVIFTTSLIGAVRHLWRESQLHVITAPRGEPILRNHPHVDQLWVLDKDEQHRSIIGMLKWAIPLRGIGFDVILNAHPSFRSRLLTRMIGAPHRIGYEGFGAAYSFTRTVPNNLAVEPDHVARRIALLNALGFHVKPEPLHIALSEAEIANADTTLREYDLQDKPLMGLIPGSAWATKVWDIRKFSDVLRRWLNERKGGVVVIGGSGEKTILEELQRIDQRAVIPLIAEPLPRVAAFLSKCDAVVGNDTGVSFLAIAAGAKRVLVMYGCTQVNYSFPPPHRAIAADVPCCLPRTGHGAHHCRWAERPWCMEQISVDRVWYELSPPR